MPDAKYKAWMFAPKHAADPAADMASAIASYALPYMRSVGDLGELCRQLEARPGVEQLLIYRRPVALMLAGRVAEAQTNLDRALATLGTRTDLAADEYRRFAESLRRRWLT